MSWSDLCLYFGRVVWLGRQPWGLRRGWQYWRGGVGVGWVSGGGGLQGISGGGASHWSPVPLLFAPKMSTHDLPIQASDVHEATFKKISWHGRSD